MKLKLGILFGGNSIEREISKNSAKQIMKFINKEKYEIKMFELPKENNTKWIFNLINFKPDVVLSALHGGIGENGSIQGLLECFNIPYVGSGVLSSAISIDKSISKIIMRAANIPVPDDLFIKKGSDIISFSEKINEIGYPVIIKPNTGGGSIGINIAENFEDVINFVFYIENEINDDILIEKFVSGKEVTCAIVENENGLSVLPVMDVVASNRFYDYNSKYNNNIAGVHFSALPDYFQTMIKEVAKKIFSTFKCKGYACIDFIIYEEQIYVLEINTLPGLTANSTITRSISEQGTNFSDFLDNIIQNAIK